MTLKLSLVVLLLLASRYVSEAEVVPPTPDSFATSLKFFIEPSSSSLKGGRARLIVGTLCRQPGIYVGDYSIKVIPYFFKNETGKLSVMVSDEALAKLGQCLPVDLTGRATTNVTGKNRPIAVAARPASKDRGALTIVVTTENGKLAFDTTYRLGDK
jgi:hypothetical protein